jgi:hypothetical protein
MNRTLKRPMFRIGGMSAEGITSGLDKPRMANVDMEMKMQRLREAFLNYKQQGGTLSFEDFSRIYAEENFNSGGRVGYQTGGFSAAGLPGFLTGFGLNLLATPPQGNIFQTSAVAAREPFANLQRSQMAAAKTAGERAFITSEREKGQEFKKKLQEIELASLEKRAGMKKEDDLKLLSIEKYLNEDLPPLVAERAGTFEVTEADNLRAQVTGPRYGGVLTFDIRDRDITQSSAGKKALAKLDGKFVYDPFDDNYKYIRVINGVEYFDEFKTIGEITLPDIKTEGVQEKITQPPSDFGMSIDDPSA